MSRGTAKSALVLAFAALLLAAQQPQQDCRPAGGVEDIYGAPVQRARIAVGQAVPVRADAVLALEQFQVSSRIWRTDREIALPRNLRFTYPAGIRVAAMRSEAGERRCLRDAVAYSNGPARGTLVPCLVDADGDGAYERADLFRRDDLITTGRPARFRLARSVRLDAPVRLTEDPSGLSVGRIFVFRRIRVVATDAASVTLLVEHADEPAWRTEPTALETPGATVLHAPPGEAKPLDYVPWSSSRRSIGLSDGAIAAFGGISFRIARIADGWTMTPLTERFPAWISAECGGSRLRIGRP